MSVRKRTWTTGKGEAKSAWQADYTDASGKRRRKNFDRKKDAEPFLDNARVEVRAGVRRILAGLWLSMVMSISAQASPLDLRMCAQGERNTSTKTCIVDGDTFWLDGVKYRLEGYDTPEPQSNICGGAREIALAHKASARFQDLLRTGDVKIVALGRKGSAGRDLVHIYVNGRDIGEILVGERLARWWPDGDEWWCN